MPMMHTCHAHPSSVPPPAGHLAVLQRQKGSCRVEVYVLLLGPACACVFVMPGHVDKEGSSKEEGTVDV